MKEAMTQRQRDAVTRRISNVSHPRVVLNLPLLLLAATLILMPVETSHSFNKVLSDLAASDPGGDWDQDGLLNAEEAEYSTNPLNEDTDYDACLDGKDGWAGGTDRWFEALLAPPRLPKVRYALIDIGTGWGPNLKVNSKGQVFGYRSEGQCLWDEGEIIVLPSQQSGKSIYYADMNNKGEFIGVMDGDTEIAVQPKIIRWNRASGLSTIDVSPIVGSDSFTRILGMPSLNDYGVAVGLKNDLGQSSPGGSGSWHYDAWATLRLAGSTVTQTPHIYRSTSSDEEQYPVGWTADGRLIFPAFIKNNGRIAGTYRDIQEGGNYEIWPTGIVSVAPNGTQYAIPGPAGVFSFTEQGHMLGSENSEIYMWVHKYGQYHKRSANYGFLNSRLELAEISNGSIWRNFKSFYLESLVDYEDYDFMYPMGISENGIMITAGLNASDSEYHSLLLVPIQITFEPVGDNDNISDNKYPTAWDENGNPTAWKWMEGHGKRIFPDAKTPNDSTNRNEVYVKVTGPPDGWKVQLKVFDVDDPTPANVDTDPVTGQQHIIDANDASGEKGNDNRGSAAVFMPGDAAQIECTIGPDGLAKIGGNLPKLKVGMKPGDNYRVAAILLKPDGTPFDGQSMNGQVTNKAGSGYIPSGDEPANGFSGVVSPMLTVWRQLHVEQDTMEQVPVQGSEKNFISGTVGSSTVSGSTFTIWPSSQLSGDSNQYEDGKIFIDGWQFAVNLNTSQWISVEDDAQGHLAALRNAGQLNGQAFQLFDDDDQNTPNQFKLPLPTSEKLITPRVRSKFTPAYIELDTNVDNPNSVVSFKLNQAAPLSGGKDVADSEKYWAYRAVAAYQYLAAEDGDPDSEKDEENGGMPLGHSWGGDALIYMEGIREQFKNSVVLGGVSEFELGEMKKARDGTVAHEIGHGANGLLGHFEGGLMDANVNPDAAFSPKTIKRFREVSKWQ